MTTSQPNKKSKFLELLSSGSNAITTATPRQKAMRGQHVLKSVLLQNYTESRTNTNKKALKLSIFITIKTFQHVIVLYFNIIHKACRRIQLSSHWCNTKQVS